MGDKVFISEIRTQQQKLVNKLLDILWEEFDCQTTAENMVGLAEADIDAIIQVYRNDLKGEIVGAVQGYTDWLATQLLRGPQEDEVPLPNPSALQILDISSKRGASGETIIYVIANMEGDIPLIGTIADDKIKPNWNALNEWSDLFKK